MQIIQDEALCETFGWTPQILDSIDLEIIDGFTAVLSGRQKGETDRLKSKK